MTRARETLISLEATPYYHCSPAAYAVPGYVVRIPIQANASNIDAIGCLIGCRN